MRVIDLPRNNGSFFIRRDSDTTTFTPYSELSAWIFDFCLHRLSWFHLASPAPFESERRPRWCSPPDACMSPACTSTQVFRLREPQLFQFPRSGRRRTKWERGTFGSERPDTTASRPWAMKKHSRHNSLLGLSAQVRRFDLCFYATCMRILLGSIRPQRGRQSRNESKEIDSITIALTTDNSQPFLVEIGVRRIWHLFSNRSSL
jgi:hypothetical protein